MIVYSDIESDVFGLNTGRIEEKEFNSVLLSEEWNKRNYHLVRIRVPSGFIQINDVLHKAGHEFYFAGGIRKLIFEETTPIPAGFINTDLSVELYDGSQKKALEHIIDVSFSQNPVGYYRTPNLNRFITKDLELQAMKQYYVKYYNSSEHPSNFIFFMKRGEEYAGLCALKLTEEWMDCPLGAVVPEVRNQSVFYDILRHSRRFAAERGVKRIRAGMRLENSVSQYVFLKQANQERVKIVEDSFDYLFHVFSLPE
jgi:hypothetical protein